MKLSARDLAKGRGYDLPETVIIGMVRGEWPVRFYTHELDALGWVAQDPEAFRLWRVGLVIQEELVYVPPVPHSLTAKPWPGVPE